MSSLSRLLYSLVRLMSVIAIQLTQNPFSLFLRNMSFLVPKKRLYESDDLIVFYHPRPAYATHILLMPKADIRSLHELSPTENQPFLVELFQVVRDLVNELQLETEGYRLISNGGDYQEIPHLHFHLVSDKQTGSA